MQEPNSIKLCDESPMKILNNRLNELIDRNIHFRMELGSGPCKDQEPKSLFKLDQDAYPGIDIVADLNHPLHLIPDGIVDYIYTRHTLEHIQNLIGLMEEIHRIISKDGIVNIVVPHYSNTYGHSDPTHVRLFGVGSMYYFCNDHNQPLRKVPSFYSKARFKVIRIRLRFYREDWFDNLLAPLLEKIVNRSYKSQVFYERHFSYLFPAWEIKYQLKKDASV